MLVRVSLATAVDMVILQIAPTLVFVSVFLDAAGGTASVASQSNIVMIKEVTEEIFSLAESLAGTSTIYALHRERKLQLDSFRLASIKI